MDKKSKNHQRVKSYIFDYEAPEEPLGTKFRGKHLEPGEDPWAMNRRWWLVTLAGAVAALAAGLLIGRFLLP
jgi:hypothetical protein